MALTPALKALIEWTVTPKLERKFETQQALAVHLGVSEKTLSMWKRSEEFKEAITAASLEWVEEKLPKILQVTALSAMVPGPTGAKDREIFAKYIQPGLIKARQERFFDVLKTETVSQTISRESALQLLRDFPLEQQEQFLMVLQGLGQIRNENQNQDQDQDQDSYIQVRKDDDEFIDLVPELPVGPGPGRPRGSRKVRLKRLGEPVQD